MNFDAINQTVDSVAGRIVRNRLHGWEKGDYQYSFQWILSYPRKMLFSIIRPIKRKKFILTP